jgi:drug/metabolite transporter (DMT)-like permease
MFRLFNKKMPSGVLASLVLMGAIICGSTVPLFLKYFTSYIDGWTSNGYRYPFATIFYLPWLYYFYKKGKLNKKIWILALVPAAGNLAAQCFWAWAPYYINPGLISFLARISIVWSIVGSFILFRDERSLLFSKRFWGGLSLAVAGYIGTIIARNGLPGGVTLTGIIIVLMFTLCGAVYRLGVRRNLIDIDPRLAFSVISLYTSVGTVTLLFFLGEPMAFTRIPGNVLILIALSALIGIGTAHVLYYFAMKRLGVAICSSFSFSAMFITAGWSFFLFDERLTIMQWICGIIMMSGGFLLLWSQEKVRAAATKQR